MLDSQSVRTDSAVRRLMPDSQSVCEMPHSWQAQQRRACRRSTKCGGVWRRAAACIRQCPRTWPQTGGHRAGCRPRFRPLTMVAPQHRVCGASRAGTSNDTELKNTLLARRVCGASRACCASAVGDGPIARMLCVGPLQCVHTTQHGAVCRPAPHVARLFRRGVRVRHHHQAPARTGPRRPTPACRRNRPLGIPGAR
jgi:hypothetical protein